MKKRFWIAVILSCLATLGLLAASCSRDTENAGAVQSETAEVQRGNIAVDITAVGNLALSQEEDLAFETAGTVDEVSVEEGDNVEEGQVLARLNTSDWESQVETLDDKVTADERAVTSKERALDTAKGNLSNLQLAVQSKELAVSQKELDVQTAEYNLSQLADVKKIQDTIDEATYALKFAKSMLAGDFGGTVTLNDYSYWSSAADKAQTQLTQAQQDLDDLLAGRNITISTTVALQIAQKQLAVDQARLQLETAKNDLENARTAVENGQITIDDAQTAVDDAEKNLAKDRDDLSTLKDASPEITAPFSGFIVKVNVKGGQEVKKGTVAVTLADPDKFEADVLINENDIFQIRENGPATVQVDAAQGVTLPALITHISPTANIQQGVVNYKVTVELQSTRPAALAANRTGPQFGLAGLAEGQLPPRLQQLVDSGAITKEQAQRLIDNLRSGNFTAPGGAGFGGGNFGGGGTSGGFGGGTFGGGTAGGGFGGGFFGGSQAAAGQLPFQLTDSFQLRDGLSVTVTIRVQEANNVLVVPNAAVSVQGGRDYVTVLKTDGSTEQREIQPGISDFQNTEVTDGLSEGEKVVINHASSTASTTQSGQRTRIPGFGGFGR